LTNPIDHAWDFVKYLDDEGERDIEYRAEYDAARNIAQSDAPPRAEEGYPTLHDEMQSMGPNDLKHLYDMIEAYKEQCRYKDQLIDALRNQLSVLQGHTPEDMYSPRQLNTRRPSALTGGKYSHLLPETNFE
tara:strand:- start:23868 stop:24263 length:396 start_codon:yes stop_codon:yes gene_type:complete